MLNAFFSLIIIALSVVSCEKKSITYDKIDILTLPSLTARDFTTTYTDSGNIQLDDGHDVPVASVTAKYAKYVDDKKLWELKDSVVAVNEAGERLETELLYWDQKKALIYTDRFVKITTEDQIIQGYGLESDPKLSKRRIKNLSAIIYIEEQE